MGLKRSMLTLAVCCFANIYYLIDTRRKIRIHGGPRIFSTSWSRSWSELLSKHVEQTIHPSDIWINRVAVQPDIHSVSVCDWRRHARRGFHTFNQAGGGGSEGSSPPIGLIHISATLSDSPVPPPPYTQYFIQLHSGNIQLSAQSLNVW